jgi:hypothetical protein
MKMAVPIVAVAIVVVVVSVVVEVVTVAVVVVKMVMPLFLVVQIIPNPKKPQAKFLIKMKKFY